MELSLKTIGFETRNQWNWNWKPLVLKRNIACLCKSSELPAKEKPSFLLL
jgi:hypothetical protein